jgi:hypothetical protein
MEKLRDIKTVVQRHKKLGKVSWENDYEGYRVNRAHADAYFDHIPEVRVKVQEKFAKMRSKGEKIVHIDIAGNCSALSYLRADISYLSPLTVIPYREQYARTGEVFVPGNVFDAQHIARLKEKVLEESGRPALITFNPIAGLQRHDPLHNRWVKVSEEVFDKVTFAMLEKRLKTLLGMLTRGGFMFVERPLQSIGIVNFLQGIPQDQTSYAHKVREIAEANKCSVTFYKGIGGPYALIRRR